ncbi:NrfD/PsrC family molybdoenzyme membrane anchor subunit [Magnetococcales bacterium HHB-1]
MNILLIIGMIAGFIAYLYQSYQGLEVTGLSDSVVWGLYIANFTFMVGIAASSVIVVILAALYHQQIMQPLLPFAKVIAISAVSMSLLFVWVDLGQPLKVWHALPYLGTLNFPRSILAWDMVALTLYLLINLYLWYHFLKPQKKKNVLHDRLFLLLVILSGLSIHTITAFMFAGNPARPFWYTALLAPRFIVSAFASGSALIILLLPYFNRLDHKIDQYKLKNFFTIFLITTLWIHLYFLGSELFVHLYRHHHSGEALHHLLSTASQSLWFLSALILTLLALLMLSIPQLRQQSSIHRVALIITIISLWMEKGIGLLIPGFIPTPTGESHLLEYMPTAIEITVSLGILSFGFLLFLKMNQITAQYWNKKSV